MTLSQEKVEAYAKLEEAIQGIIDAYKDDCTCGDRNLGWMTTGWLLVTNEVRLPTPQEQEEHPEYDELDYIFTSGCYTRRGQEPIIGLGLAHEFIRHYNELNNEVNR